MADAAEIPLTREFLVEPGFWWRAARTMSTDWMLRRPTTWILALLVVIVVIVAPTEWSAKLQILGVILAIILISALLTFFAVAMAFRKQYPAGSTMRSGFGPESFVVEQPKSTTRLAYDFYRAARRSGELVLMRMGRSLWVPYPGALFGDDDIARFNPPKTR